MAIALHARAWTLEGGGAEKDVAKITPSRLTNDQKARFPVLSFARVALT
jgi:hypothetical protein